MNKPALAEVEPTSVSTSTSRAVDAFRHRVITTTVFPRNLSF